MNLKEIAILLIGLFIGSSLLMAYKYYLVKGKVFEISRVLVFKYILRFILLVAFLLLCFYTINLKQKAEIVGQKAGATLLVISSNSSSLTWNSLVEKVKELPESGSYGLLMYDSKKTQYLQVIPNTNRDSFLHLVDRTHDLTSTHPKRLVIDSSLQPPKEDQFEVFEVANGRWKSVSLADKTSGFFSKNGLNSWIGSSYLRLYLVVLIVSFLFIDIVFTAKAIKI
jgi:hypothetical protein